VDGEQRKVQGSRTERDLALKSKKERGRAAKKKNVGDRIDIEVPEDRTLRASIEAAEARGLIRSVKKNFVNGGYGAPGQHVAGRVWGQEGSEANSHDPVKEVRHVRQKKPVLPSKKEKDAGHLFSEELGKRSNQKDLA